MTGSSTWASGFIFGSAAGLTNNGTLTVTGRDNKYLGGLYMSAKRNKEAADHLEKYLQLDPKARDADQIRNTIKDLRSKQ